MSEPRSNSEIMDVLSSIRRLVSEARKPASDAGTAPQPLPTPPSPQPEGAPSPLPGGRFVLTQALRVGETAEPAAADDERSPNSAVADWVSDAEGDRQERPALVASSPSLEETIAELEAAVSEIDADFEPDVGDDEDNSPAPLSDLEEVMDFSQVPPVPPVKEFQGIMAGFDAMPPPEERLDAPITAEGNEDLAAPLPPSEFRRTAPTTLKTPVGEPDAPSLFLRATRPVSADSLVAEEIADGDEPMDQGDDEAGDGDAGAVAMPTAEAEPTAVEAMGEDVLVEATDETIAESAGATGRLHLNGNPPRRLRIERAEDVAMIAEDAAPPEAAAALDSDDADDTDLFDPLAASDLDIDQLRDMVAELIREELRGKLGERITRNLRQLVRREIERALADLGNT